MNAKRQRHNTKSKESASQERMAHFAFLYGDIRENVNAVGYESNLAGKELARFCVRAGLGGHERDQAVFLYTTLCHVGVWVKQAIESAEINADGKVRHLKALRHNLSAVTIPYPPMLNMEPYIANLRGFYEAADFYGREKLKRIYLIQHPKEIKTRVVFDEHRTFQTDELIQGVITLEMARHAGHRIKLGDFDDKVQWFNALLESIKPKERKN